MSRRWDSHWKKQGRTGPSPFAASPSQREQWLAQLGGLKQKAAYRRSQQQAQFTEEPWIQPQQQQQQSEAQMRPSVVGKESHAAQQQQDDQKDSVYTLNRFETETVSHDSAAQQCVGGAQSHPLDGQIDVRPSLDLQDHLMTGNRRGDSAYLPETLLEMTHELPDQVQTCHMQLGQLMRLYTTTWLDQLNIMLCEALGQLQSDCAGHEISHAQDECYVKAGGQTHSVPVIVTNSETGASAIARSDGGAAHREGHEFEVAMQHGLSEAWLCEGATQVTETRVLSSVGETDSVGDNGQAEFQAQHPRIQSQLAGLKRRAARKKET